MGIAQSHRVLTLSAGGLDIGFITWKAMPASAPAPLRPSSDRPGSPEGRRLDLDVVRGLAIVLALGFHFSKEPSGVAVLDVLTWPGDTVGWAGVDLFFVLSGFLVGTLVFTEHVRTGRFDSRRFTVRRLLKLWPVLYVFLTVQAVAGPEPWTTYLWQNALHVQNYAGTSLTHLWSLAVEEHFYLALALLFPLVARRRRSPRALAAVLVALLVAALALRVWGAAHGVSEVRLQWRTHFRVDGLAAGLLLALVHVHWPERFEQLRRQRALLVGVLALGIVWLVRIGKDGVLGSTLGYTVAYLTAAAVLLLLYRARWVTRARWVSVPAAFLGRYSYGIYIWHVFAAQIAMELGGWTPHAPEPVPVLVRYAAAIAVGVVATAVVEKPVLRLRDRLLSTTATEGYGAVAARCTARTASPRSAANPPTAASTVATASSAMTEKATTTRAAGASARATTSHSGAGGVQKARTSKETTASKGPGGATSSSAPVSSRTRPSATATALRRVAAAVIVADRSTPTTSAPRAAIRSIRTPWPKPTSSSRSPGCGSTTVAAHARRSEACTRVS